MHILVVTSYYKPASVYGGPVHCVSAMCEAFTRLGCEVTVLTTNANGNHRLDVPLGQPVNLGGVEVNYYPIASGLPQSFFYSPALVKAIREKIKLFDIVDLDILFGHAMGPASTACKQMRVPYVVPLHGQLLPWSLRQKKMKKKIFMFFAGRSYLNSAAAIHCTVPTEAEAVSNLGVRVPKIIVPFGVDSYRFANLPLRGVLRKRLNIPLDANLILFLGRLHVKKRPDIAVDALAAAQSLPGETHLVLAGPDEMQLTPKLQAKARQLGCGDRLHVTGLIKGDDLLSSLADADLFIMPSEPESENFGMSAVEAMASGLPILVSEGVPVGIWAETAGAGRVVACTPDAFKNMTSKMLSNKTTLMEMGHNGRALAREKFDILSVAQQMLRQYQAIISTGQPIPDC